MVPNRFKRGDKIISNKLAEAVPIGTKGTVQATVKSPAGIEYLISFEDVRPTIWVKEDAIEFQEYKAWSQTS